MPVPVFLKNLKYRNFKKMYFLETNNTGNDSDNSFKNIKGKYILQNYFF